MELIYGEHEGRSLYIIEACGGVFIGSLDIPTENSTIKDYMKWRYGFSTDMIAISESYFPQNISNSSIKQVKGIHEMIQYIINEYRIDMEEITMPFIGGIIGMDFRELLIELFKIARDRKLSFYDAERITYNYLKNLIVKVSEESK